MKPTVEPNEDSSSTTTEIKNSVPVKENIHLFSHLDKLAASHDVRISNTMIKVTYKKAFKDQNASDNDCNGEAVLLKNMNCSEGKSDEADTMDLCNSELSLIVKSGKVHAETAQGTAYHSTPKQQTFAGEKKKKYLNGIGLSPRANGAEDKNGLVKVQKEFSSQKDRASSPRKSKTISVKKASKPETSKRFLKDSDNLVKCKSSIVRKKVAEEKKIAINKAGNKRHKKLENDVKKNLGVDKRWLKRKASSTDLKVKCKKRKISEKKPGEGGEKEGNELVVGRKPIMLIDPDLPKGWTRYIRTKNKGSTNEKYVVYVVSPQGKQFRFKWKLRKYLEKTNSSLDVDQFFFGLYQRPKTWNVSAADKDEDSTDDATPVSEGESRDESPKAGIPLKRDAGENGSSKSSDEKELLLHDPDLPFGWKRVIHSNISSGKKQVHIISPDGKIFRRRYRLNQYLTKHQYTHNLDRFYFGLYPKKEEKFSEISQMESVEKTSNSVKNSTKKDNSAMISLNSEMDNDNNRFGDKPRLKKGSSPAYDDPSLPKGWKKLIRIRSCGESAGRMEVVIVSPDGRRHRTRKHLEHYLLQKDLQYKAEDFDFRVLKKPALKNPAPPVLEPAQEQDHEANDFSFLSPKKKFTDKPVPELDIDSLKDIPFTHEGHLINAVTGLMISCGLTSPRNERRQRLPRKEHENQLKSHLIAEGNISCDGCEIPTYWIQRLVKCRGDFRTLEPDAASTVGDTVKDLIKKISLVAFATSKEPNKGLRYENVAEVVHAVECLSPLKSVIPKKITYKEYIKLNKSKQFWSFT